MFDQKYGVDINNGKNDNHKWKYLHTVSVQNTHYKKNLYLNSTLPLLVQLYQLNKK